MSERSTADGGDGRPSTALMERMLARATEVAIVEASPEDVERADAARIVVSGQEIAELAQLLAIVDGGTGDRCRCLGWPTILLVDAAGGEYARWTLHHQASLAGLGSCDAALRDGPGLTQWLAGHGLTGSREIQQILALQGVEEEQRRGRWVQVAPQVLTAAAEAVSRSEPGAEDRLADQVARLYPDAVERIRVLLAWAGFPPRQADGRPWYETMPERLLLAEQTESIFEALLSAPLTPPQLDGAAELCTSLEWKSRGAVMPELVRSALIAHVTATGTDPMKFRMRHGYDANRT